MWGPVQRHTAGLTPAIRAGGGDAGSLLPGVLPPELGACLCGHIVRDMPPVIGAVTVGYVAAPGPLLAPPVLAGDDGLDESALAFLVQQTLLAREKEEAEAVEAAELAELAANLARTEERIVDEIDRLRVLRDRSDLTQLWNRCCRWHLQRTAVKKLKEKRKKKRKKRLRRWRRSWSWS